METTYNSAKFWDNHNKCMARQAYEDYCRDFRIALKIGGYSEVIRKYFIYRREIGTSKLVGHYFKALDNALATVQSPFEGVN